jgi:hypothetical protein
MGHLDLTRQGQKSTKAYLQRAPPSAIPLNNDMKPLVEAADTYLLDDGDVFDSDEIQNIYMLLVPVEDVCSADATGKFPFTSRRGHKYILIFDWQGYVHSEPLESLSAVAYAKAYTRAY